MPFALKKALATFQTAIDLILSFVRWQLALIYFDDIVVFSKSPQNRSEQVRHVLRPLYDAVATLKLKKCRFLAENIDYLGHVNRPGHQVLAEYSTDAVVKLGNAITQTELRSSLGMRNVLGRSYRASRFSSPSSTGS